MDAGKRRVALQLAVAVICAAPQVVFAGNACYEIIFIPDDLLPVPPPPSVPKVPGIVGGIDLSKFLPPKGSGTIPPGLEPSIPCYNYDRLDANISRVQVQEVMEAGKSYPIRVDLSNNGMEIWGPGSGHRLASNSQSGNVWGIETVAPKAAVRNGNLVTLEFTVTAPSQPGTYEFRWQMRKGDSEWFGNPTRAYSISVVGPDGAIPTSPDFVARYFVYDAQQRLCKVVEPETGVTVIDYEANGNVAWTASGLSYPDRANCNRAEAHASGRRVDRRYDKRNRIAAISYPDGKGDQKFEYTPDGLRQRVESVNHGGVDAVVNNYVYNRRRLLTAESQILAGLPAQDVGYGYDGNGHRSSVRYPSGYTVQYINDALGHARSVRASTGEMLADNIRYHPSGAIESLRYGSGITRTATFNARQLPQLLIDSGVSSLSFSYDASANVASIRDGVRGSSFDRSMTYDLDNRLTVASSSSFSKDKQLTFAYDGLDNITSSFLKGTTKDMSFWYDQRNRLTNVMRLGVTTVGINYDAQGNLSRRNGQVYQFDLDNRLRKVPGIESYLYDADGRRVSALAEGGARKRSFYGTEGALLFEQRPAIGDIEHIYVDGTLFASREARSVVSIHTDALGTTMARTNAAGQLLEQRTHEPYGGQIGSAVDGIGFTGHVMDTSTGLTYMQQRYYDPVVGRFVSADPLSASQIDGTNFNRYAYANNNPYKYQDPDGEFGLVGAGIGMGFEFAIQMATSKGSFSERLSNVDVTDILVAGAVGAVTGGLGGRAAIQASKGLLSTASAVSQTAKVGAATSSLGSGAKDLLNGDSPDATKMIASGAVGGLSSSIGSRIGLARITALEKAARSSAPGGPNIASTTRSVLRPGEIPVSATQASGQQGVDISAGLVDDRIERWLNERTKDD